MYANLPFATSNYYLRFAIIFPLLFPLLFLLTCSVLTPYFETRLMVGEHQIVNSVLAKICHQFPSRCLYMFESNMGLCSRCFSIYSTLFLCSICFIYINTKLSWKHRSIIALTLFIPLIVDGTTQLYNLRVSNNYIRLITGMMAGLGISIFFVSPYITSVTNLLAFIIRKNRKEF